MIDSAQHIPFEEKQDLNKILLSWKGPSHPFKKRNKLFYQTVAALTFLFVVIVFFLQEFLLIGVILSIAFVVYVISTVEPMEVEQKITPVGINNAGRLFRWSELTAFWFKNQWEYKILVVQTRLPFPAQIQLVLRDVAEEKIKETLGKYLLYMEKPPKSWVDNVSTWVSNKIPLEASN